VSSAGVAIPLILSSSPNTQDNSLDKFASIPGLRISLNLQELKTQLLKVGSAIAAIPSQTSSSIRRIHEFDESSAAGMSLAETERLVLSQKLAGRIQGIVFDIKVGEGASLMSREEAKIFVSSLEKVCKRLEIGSSFILNDLNQPLGESIGNCLEVRETIKILKGNGPLDVLRLVLELGSEMLLLARKAKTKTEAKSCLKRKIEEGQALRKFKEIIKAQGGNSLLVSDDSLFPRANLRKILCSPIKGYLQRIKMEEINHLWHELTTSQPNSDRTGFLIFKKIGERVEEDEVITEVHLNNVDPWLVLGSRLKKAFVLSKKPPGFKPFIIESIRKTQNG
jgi:pyrimidine-nucleoside phosphorylase